MSACEKARAAGVSAAAVYRHSPEKAALLRGFAAPGPEQLASAQRAAFENAGGKKAGVVATGRAYASFALDNPAFRLIFSSSPEQRDEIGAGGGTAEAFRMLRENAALLAPPEASCDEVHLVALGAWAKVHGLAVVMPAG